MTDPPDKAVFDCNVFLQALGNPLGPAGRCVQAALDGRFQLLVDQQLLDELADVATRNKLIKKLKILPNRLPELLSELKLKAFFVSPAPQVFHYSRDPDDAHYVDLAIATGAFLVVSRDKDLLDLMNDEYEPGRELRAAHPMLRILTPPQFLREIES